MILAVDIGGTNTKYAVFHKERIITRGEWKTISDKATIIDKITSILPSRCSAVCISTGGYWNSEKSIGYETLKSMADGSFITELTERIGCKVFIDNDARCALYSEIAEGALKGYDNGAVVLLGSSVGCAVMIGGKPYKGSTGQAAQLFFMPEFYDGDKYVFDEYANTRKITQEYGGVDTKGNFFKIEEDSLNGNTRASILINRYIKTVAIKCWYLYLMYDIGIIAIGGGVANSDFIFNGIVGEVKKFFLMDRTTRCPNIVKTVLGKDSILTGAMLLRKEEK